MKPVIFLLLITCLKSAAQTAVPFNSSRWKIAGQEAVQEDYQGKQCLKITNGRAILQDAAFKNGIIEFDMAVSQARYFPGMGFRMQDENNTEEFYLRPHQSGNPDAMQYYPEYNGDGAWQLYYGEGFNNPHKIPFDRWMHIKLLVKETMAEVYLDNEPQPALFINKLYRPVATGMIALENVWPVAARFANFTYTATDDVTLANTPKPDPPLLAGMFTYWQVSRPFDEKQLAGKTLLADADTIGLNWQTLYADGRGVVDLSTLNGTAPGKNTVFAKLVLVSDRPHTQKFAFGFSDRAKVYLNNKLLYSGEDGFQSRDYRFLGTMGYWDAVYLDLKAGKNEIWIAVSEDYGGWGVMAKLEDF
jgi:hypothetical protein